MVRFSPPQNRTIRFAPPPLCEFPRLALPHFGLFRFKFQSQFLKNSSNGSGSSLELRKMVLTVLFSIPTCFMDHPVLKREKESDVERDVYIYML